MSPPPTSNRPAALIFRSRLLEWSETFIAAQSEALSRYRPVYAGYRMLPAGEGLIGRSERVLLEEHAWLPALREAQLKLTIRPSRRWLAALQAHAPALLHAHFGFSARVPVRIAQRLNIPLVITYHGADIAVERRGRIDRIDRSAAFTRAGRLVAVSTFIADRLRAAGAPRDRIVVHYIGVDTDRFTPAPGTVRDRTVLFVGRLVAKKGLVHLLHAMRRVQAEIPDAKLIVAGDGPLRARLETVAQGLNVRFVGVQSPAQIAAWMQRCGVLCAPFVVSASGNAEGLGMTSLEAQASGMPVVISPSGGSAEAVIDGETGFVVPAHADALAERLLLLLRDDDLRARMGAAARQHVSINFDLRRQTTKLETIYDDVVREHLT